MESCIDCPSHEVLPDPDPHDWFCDDDVMVVCNHELDEYLPNSKKVTVACRPYNIRKETSPTPDWCPLKG